MAIRQITIVGTGLIGGSLGLALRQRGFAGTIVGCDKPEVLETAITRGAIDRGGTDIKEAVQGSDIVVFATPVGAILSLFEKLAPTLPPDHTDHRYRQHQGTNCRTRAHGSWRGRGERVLPGTSHGRQRTRRNRECRSGVVSRCRLADHADRLRISRTRRGSRSTLICCSPSERALWRLTPERHDRLCAWISHLPQMISTALASLLREELGDDEAVAQIGGRALREMTRIAHSPYSMWRDIALTNSQNLEEALLRFEQQLAHLRENLRGPGLRELFESANQFGREQTAQHDDVAGKPAGLNTIACGPIRELTMAMNKVVANADEAIHDIKDGDTLMLGGFGLCGIPENLIRALVKKGVKDLHTISNNVGIDDAGLGLMLAAGQIKSHKGSYVGENRLLEEMVLTGRIDLELIPQGTLAERIRAGGAGIPAFYTPAGFGTVVAEGKETREFGGRPYVLERALTADFALIKAWKGDRWGNLVYRKTAQNFNPMMATAARITIAEVEHLVEPGEIDPDQVHTPSIYVHRIFQGTDYEKRIERRTVRKA